jgi:hypothetical protein
MNPHILIPLVVAAILLPVATGGNPAHAYREAACILVIIAGIYAGFTALSL